MASKSKSEKFLTIQPSFLKPRRYSIGSLLTHSASDSRQESRSPSINQRIMNTNKAKSSVCGNLAEDDCISVESSTSSCDIVEEDDIVAEEDQEVEASFASLMNKVVDKISDTFQGGPKIPTDYNDKRMADDLLLLAGSQGGHVKKKIQDIIDAEKELEMDGKLKVEQQLAQGQNATTDAITSQQSEFFKPMSLLEKEWEFTMCSNKLDQVKKFLEEHPFQEEPQQHFRFVNYRSKINGNTVLHYAAQCCNVNLAIELIKNRGVDASIVNNIGMTPLHTLAQVRLAHNDPGVKKITLARLFLLPSLKKKQSMKAGVDGGKGGVEVLEPILTGPYVRDYYGRKACDLLPPEHQATMREIFRAEVPEIVHKPKEKRDVIIGKQSTNAPKPSLFESIFGSKSDSSSKNRNANQGSHGIPSAAARSLPMLNRSQSNAKQSPHHKTSLPSRTRPTPHQVASPRTSTTTGSSSPRKAASASLFTSSPQNETIVEDSET
ncbi:uncharacterized protein LOC134849598 isoform X2 [Symsagittifera roscoffensis]|uniref:uncharacterized protein LOC134849598 isoform X2 n=1 Tax=Symsagittifera roscoffensis TaxID=84072 RepID=UPI00307BCC01